MRNVRLEYKGFFGAYSYSREDNCWHGKLDGISDLITFESEDFDGLPGSFADCGFYWKINTVINMSNQEIASKIIIFCLLLYMTLPVLGIISMNKIRKKKRHVKENQGRSDSSL